MKLEEIDLSKGYSFEDYQKGIIEFLAETSPETLSSEDHSDFENTKLNLQRSTRILKTYSLSDEVQSALNKIEPQTWVVITEAWCGDSAQIIPHLAIMEKNSSKIKMVLFYRDRNPKLMDKYLTNGTRSIPKLIAFNSEGEELFTWGPRPKEAVEQIKQWKEKGLEKHEWLQHLHLWYAKNKGKEIEKDILELLSNHI